MRLIQRFVIVALLILPTSLRADDAIRIKLLFSRGDNWIGEAKVDSFRRQLTGYLRTKINPNIQISSSIIGDVDRGLTSTSLPELIKALANYAVSRRHAYNYDLVHFVLPPELNGVGVLQIGGFSSSICTIGDPSRNTSYSNAELANAEGVSRWDLSVIAAAHEIGHQLGAKHISSKTLMNNQVLGFADKDVPLDRNSLKEINKCMKS